GGGRGRTRVCWDGIGVATIPRKRCRREGVRHFTSVRCAARQSVESMDRPRAAYAMVWSEGIHHDHRETRLPAWRNVSLLFAIIRRKRDVGQIRLSRNRCPGENRSGQFVLRRKGQSDAPPV